MRYLDLTLKQRVLARSIVEHHVAPVRWWVPWLACLVFGLVMFAVADRAYPQHPPEDRGKAAEVAKRVLVPGYGAVKTAKRWMGKAFPYYASEGLLVWDADGQRLVHLPDVKIKGGAAPLSRREALALAADRSCVTPAGRERGHTGDLCTATTEGR